MKYIRSIGYFRTGVRKGAHGLYFLIDNVGRQLAKDIL